MNLNLLPRTPRRMSTSRKVLFVLILWFNCFIHLSGAPKIEEGLLKVTMIYKFEKFCSWPETKTTQDYIVIGDENWLEKFQSLNAYIKKDKGHDMKLKHILDEDEVLKSDKPKVLFIEEKNGGRYHEILTKLNLYGVLTIGENEEFLKAGGMIAMIRHKGAVRWLINQDAVSRSGIELNAQLYRYALKNLKGIESRGRTP